MNIYKNDPFTHHGDGFLSGVGHMLKRTNALRDSATAFSAKHKVISKFIVPKIAEYMGADATMQSTLGDIAHRITGHGFNTKRSDRRMESSTLSSAKLGKTKIDGMSYNNARRFYREILNPDGTVGLHDRYDAIPRYAKQQGYRELNDSKFRPVVIARPRPNPRQPIDEGEYWNTPFTGKETKNTGRGKKGKKVKK